MFDFKVGKIASITNSSLVCRNLICYILQKANSKGAVQTTDVQAGLCIYCSMQQKLFSYTKANITNMAIKHTVSGRYRPTSETPFQWRFAGGPIVVRFNMRTGLLFH